MSNNSSGLYQTCSISDDPNFVCTPETCCLAQGQIQYIPTLIGNSLYAGIFGLILLSSVCIGIRYRTFSFTTWMTFGLAGEIVGYIGRIMLHNNIFSFDAFLTYLVPLTISPAFLTACIYLCLARIIHVMDPSLTATRLKPRTYTAIFVTSDFICLVLQGAGGGVAATSDGPSDKLGVNMMIAGLALQVLSIIIFIVLCSDFAWRLNKGTGVSRGKYMTIEPFDRHRYTLTDIRTSRMFKGFVISLAVATILILVRSVYRLAELQGGFDSAIANNEISFMIFEGPMIILAVLALTIFHPGFSLGRHGLWKMKVLQDRSFDGEMKSKNSEEKTKMVPMTNVESSE